MKYGCTRKTKSENSFKLVHFKCLLLILTDEIKFIIFEFYFNHIKKFYMGLLGVKMNKMSL